ncbi:MAG: SWIM zinc finger family protein [Verrucomicrobiota bacterium]
MSWYSDFEYENAADRKARITRQIAKRVKAGEPFTAFDVPPGTKIVKNFWGLAWCRHLETYCGYETRLPRGRTYLRQGHVYNLRVEKGHITADVTGSEIYEVEITIQPLPAAKWKSIRRQCEGQVASLLDLLSGKLGDGVMKIVSDPVQGLFPSRKEIKHFCTCPDPADLCKHRAAVLYAVGVLFDRDPKFLFDLRGADPSELIATSAASLTGAGKAGTGTDVLADDDLSALFGIDFTDSAPPAPVSAPALRVSPAPTKPKVRTAPESKVKASAKSAAPAAPAVKTAAKRTAGSAKTLPPRQKVQILNARQISPG